jgi:hypothetical protein
MEDNRFWKPGIHQLRHPFPRHPILLAATPQRASPEVGHMMPEHIQCPTVGRHCVIIEVAADNPPQPFPWLGIGWCLRRRISLASAMSLSGLRSTASITFFTIASRDSLLSEYPWSVIVKPKEPMGCKLVGTVKGTKLWAGDCVGSELRGAAPAPETNLPAAAAGAIPPGQKQWEPPDLLNYQLRLSILPLCFLLVACSSHPEDLPTAVINPPDPSKVTAVLGTVAAAAKIQEPLEVSAPIPANPASSIPWIICLRSGATEESKRHTYSAFFKNND